MKTRVSVFLLSYLFLISAEAKPLPSADQNIVPITCEDNQEWSSKTILVLKKELKLAEASSPTYLDKGEKMKVVKMIVERGQTKGYLLISDSGQEYPLGCPSLGHDYYCDHRTMTEAFSNLFRVDCGTIEIVPNRG